MRRTLPLVWDVALTVRIDRSGPQTLRDWLTSHCEACPRRFADQLCLFIDCQLTSNADYDGVCLSFDITECRPKSARRVS